MNERLFITVPAGLALWAAAFTLLALCAGRPADRPLTGRDTVTVRLVMQATPPAPAEKPAAIPPPPAPVAARPAPRPVIARNPPPVPRRTVTTQEHDTPPPPPPRPAQRLSQAKTENHGPTILSQPMPAIPDDLREQAFSTFAVVRFHVAADGSATATLLTPSQNPRLNLILMRALKEWRFKSAVENGRPVAAAFTIRVRFAVE